ncbi:MAG TPA: SGNH/GDSL hydrolase family protein [Blastocatellia bacterium]|nr:SGNH/GDSL hydrolase family protein [Blastocatellia bacterium]HMV86996.1 SGNH/GDSL hydrolase family protein [Blastocatellia bacterium]HMX30463.1 SGNH/GDSL hydrolase family protein [Blastocatellia bacterium]HMY76725.1 SGNH/GDSL hydrolase family protein [Blastocatellia bacterium]HMZ21932.1 SGNH/GDSL hydrolase family protein [Blastocatellia bacterium]
MRKVFYFVLIVVLGLLPATASQLPQQSAAGQSSQKLRVLFIGNSYTYYNNLPRMLAGLAASAKPARVLETDMLTVGGATLKHLWEGGQAQQLLARGKWDYVVLQEQSTLGASKMVGGVAQINDPAEFHAAARVYDAEIKKLGAKTLFYMTWARQNNPASQTQLTEAYTKIGRELNASVAPVGLAWQAALKARPDLALHVEDKSHPNPAGSYLAACVFYAVLYGQSPEGLAEGVTGALVDSSGKPGDTVGELVKLSRADAAFLQKVAWETVRKR